MYILIFEDGQSNTAVEIGDNELSACDDGCLDIFDVRNPTAPLRYIDGEWEEIDNIDI